MFLVTAQTTNMVPCCNRITDPAKALRSCLGYGHQHDLKWQFRPPISLRPLEAAQPICMAFCGNSNLQPQISTQNPGLPPSRSKAIDSNLALDESKDPDISIASGGSIGHSLLFCPQWQHSLQTDTSIDSFRASETVDSSMSYSDNIAHSHQHSLQLQQNHRPRHDPCFALLFL